MPARPIDVSLSFLPGYGRPHVSLEGSALVFFDSFCNPDQSESLLALRGVRLTSAMLNDELLSDTDLQLFVEEYEPHYKDALEWIALSSIP